MMDWDAAMDDYYVVLESEDDGLDDIGGHEYEHEDDDDED